MAVAVANVHVNCWRKCTMFSIRKLIRMFSAAIAYVLELHCACIYPTC